MPRKGADYLTSLPVNMPDSPPNGPRTIVCFGVPRGGTSMIGGAVLGLGVPMGQGLKNNIEDPDFDIVAQGGDMPAFVQNDTYLAAALVARTKGNNANFTNYLRRAVTSSRPASEWPGPPARQLLHAQTAEESQE